MPGKHTERSVQDPAYAAWVEAGRPLGNDSYLWLRAEHEYLQHQLACEPDVDDIVQEASEESFPASDSPAWSKTSV